MSTTLLWLIAGSILCLMEFFFPSAFIEFMMGVGALLVAIASLIVPQFTLQVVLWLILSTLLVILSRRFLTPRHKVRNIGDAQEGETLTAISPGQTGRILYEGNSWQAKCEDEYQAIAPKQKVYVVRREGNTLFVLPQHMLNS